MGKAFDEQSQLQGFKMTFLMLSATCTRAAEKTIVDVLHINEYSAIRLPIDRQNLNLSLVTKSIGNGSQEKNWKFFHDAVQTQKDGDQQTNRKSAAIIYCQTVTECEKLSGQLIKMGLRSTTYHSKLSLSERAERQRLWENDEVDVIVATNAFRAWY